MSGKGFINTLEQRGFIHQTTDREALEQQKKLTGYIGFDCTADSLHVGSLLPIMLLRHLEQYGHQAIVLLGGGTSKVGDPSGKDEARQLIDSETIERNKQGIKNVIGRFLENPIYVDNNDWLAGLNYIEFLRDCGRHFSVNRMMSMESVKGRLDREQSLSFLEFNYMILQAYDFLELYKNQQCNLQMGGSDQWGNIVMGIDLVRRITGDTVYGLTAPLLTTSSGAKMGKTANGAVWLSAEKLSAYDFWQYWRNIEDDDVERFLKLFTHLPIQDIDALCAEKGAAINEAKKVLASEVTTLCHSKQAAEEATRTAEQTFEQGLTAETLPSVKVARPMLILDIILEAGFAKSKGEARRLMQGGGVKIDDQPVIDEQQLFTGTGQKLSVGKKRHAVLVD